MKKISYQKKEKWLKSMVKTKFISFSCKGKNEEKCKYEIFL